MKKVKLNENSYKRLRSALMNEISVGTVNNASQRLDTIFYHLSNAFDAFYGELEEAIYTVRWESNENEMKTNPHLDKIKEYADAIQAILDTKMKQGEKFQSEVEKIDGKKFYNSEDSKNNYLDDVELRDAQNKFPKI